MLIPYTALGNLEENIRETMCGKNVYSYLRKMFALPGGICLLLFEKNVYLFEENVYASSRKMFILIWGKCLLLFGETVYSYLKTMCKCSVIKTIFKYDITPSLYQNFPYIVHVQSSCIKGGFLKSWLGFVLVQLYIFTVSVHFT